MKKVFVVEGDCFIITIDSNQTRSIINNLTLRI